MNDFEIMAPVGSRDSLAAALKAGADSVYFGVEQLNMRSHSANHFTIDDLRDIAATCNEAGVKTYLTVNTIIYGEDIETMHQIVDAAVEAKISAVIACDIAVMTYCRKVGMEVHLSTQLNISNVEALKFYAQFADVVVLARELRMDQVAEIHRQIEEQHICGPSGELVRIEMFCHGALCMAVSGKCYMSLDNTGCSANRGFWDGYYQGQTLGEWNSNYGSNATERKRYIGKGVKYFSKLGVAEFAVEAGTFSVGDKMLITGPTTGVPAVCRQPSRVHVSASRCPRRCAPVISCLRLRPLSNLPLAIR